jgi:hypothetical protein
MPSYRENEALARQIAELLSRHRNKTEVIEEAVARYHRECFPDQYPAPATPAIIGWVRGRTADGREGWKPQVEGGAILDYIDDDID